MQFLFVSVTPAVEKPPDVRRGALYPIELLEHMKPKEKTLLFRYRIIVTQISAGVNGAEKDMPGFCWIFCGKLLQGPRGMQYN